MKIEWVEYDKKKPNKNDLVIVYRNIESRQSYITQWSEQDELYAAENEITHWAYFNHPTHTGEQNEI